MLHRCLVVMALAAAAPPALTQVDWHHYRPTNTGILGDYVQAIFIDDVDHPWIAAYTPIWEEGGMSRQNGDGTWEVLSSFDVPQITSPRFNDIVRDASGQLWIAGKGGLFRFDPAVGPSSLVRYDSSGTPMPGHEVSDVDIAPDGTVWLAIYNVAGARQGGLVRYAPATGAWQVWTTANGLTWGGGWPGWDAVAHVAVRPDLDGSGSYTVWFDSPHSLGMGTWRDGTFTWLGNPQNPPPGRYPMQFMSRDPIDELSNLWVLTNEGLVRQDASGNELVVGYPAGLGSEVSLVVALSGGRAALGTYYADVFSWSGGWSYLGNWGSRNHTYALVEDSTGALWAGGIGGSARLVDGAWQRYRLTNTGMIGFWTQAIDFAPDGRVFMNGNAASGVGGFDILDGEVWTNVNDFTYGLGLEWGLPSDDVQAMCFRASGRLAIAPAGIQGLVEWDGSSYTYLIPQGVDILEVDEDTLQRLWAVHYENGGISRITGSQVVHYTSSDSPLPAGPIGSVEIDKSLPGFVWITTVFGIAHTDGSTWSIYPRELLGLTQSTLAHLLSATAPHPDGTLWVGSHNGLYHFDPATSGYTRYHPGNSALPSNDILHVHVAPDGSVWAASFDTVWPYPGGLTHFQGASSTHYDTGNSPLPHNQVWELNSRTVASGYELWVGTASEAIAVLTLASEVQEPCIELCQSNPTSVGPGAHLRYEGEFALDVHTFSAEPVPNQPGIFFHGATQIRLPFGNGFLCAGDGLVRILPPVVAVENRAEVDVPVPPGTGVRYWQYWFRDPDAGGALFNTTDALCCSFD